MKHIQYVLDSMSMYRVVLYVLVAYIAIAFAYSLTGVLFFSPLEFVLSLVTIIGVSIAAHYTFAWIFEAPANLESTIITALILFLVLAPQGDWAGLWPLALVSFVAIASKYLLARRKLHIFNPVAVALVIVSVAGVATASWWVGSELLIIPTLIGGILITMKIRRWALVLSGILAAALVFLALGWWREALDFSYIYNFFVSWPIIFFVTVMLTEPLSTPAGTRNHVIYGSLVGALSSIPFSFGPFYSTPELALLIGNAVMYPTTLKARLVLELDKIRKVARDTYEYIFSVPHSFDFKPGQYLEWTLPHESSDNRGARRYFTIASSPTEKQVMLGLKIPKDSSSFKQELQTMQPGDVIYATSLDGDFTLPSDLDNTDVVFIAGGIGITPFRSMVKYLLDTKQQANITLFHCNDTADQIMWEDIWEQAKNAFGMHTVQVLAKPEEEWGGEQGYIDEAMLERNLQGDLQSKVYYLSGPPAMVDNYIHLLKSIGVPKSHIVTDYFPGLG